MRNRVKPAFVRLFAVAAVWLALGGRLAAQEYVGTMTYGDYRLENVRATLDVRDGQATLTLYRIKFSRMMPVRVDATLAGISVVGDSLTARRIVPTADGKPYPKYAVTGLRGSYTPQRASGSATMNGRPFSYSGRRVREKR